MTTLVLETEPLAIEVAVSDIVLSLTLDDGRQLAVPTVWFPRLLSGSQQSRDRWELIGRGQGIHWPELDEDISVAGLLAGRRDQKKPAKTKAA
ncbi:DUF2442 domain-containing protein [Phyllobacterium sp. SYP-B3895]|uniref:DUF2442 domain-containing protein n=1 Tax=Phyllobacterium sp. SYP-B3895 TaxID=2663240 RepID=UPI00129A0728|nr:DUF2442 domain-containing protein [Phyllobacterium sp. SYP-B3895]MRG56917.1 DUF2442 domain-containing protein [Phyllobacterium sp. SYP-B3895]